MKTVTHIGLETNDNNELMNNGVDDGLRLHRRTMKMVCFQW